MPHEDLLIKGSLMPPGVVLRARTHLAPDRVHIKGVRRCTPCSHKHTGSVQRMIFHHVKAAPSTDPLCHGGSLSLAQPSVDVAADEPRDRLGRNGGQWPCAPECGWYRRCRHVEPHNCGTEPLALVDDCTRCLCIVIYPNLPATVVFVRSTNIGQYTVQVAGIRAKERIRDHRQSIRRRGGASLSAALAGNRWYHNYYPVPRYWYGTLPVRVCIMIP